MEIANESAQNPLLTSGVRQAESADSSHITKMLRRAQFIHQHADWRLPSDWLGQAGAVVFTENERIRGYFAAAQDPPPVAWLRTVGIDKSDPNYVFRQLLRTAQQGLLGDGAAQIACLAVEPWLDSVLSQAGFAVQHTIQTYLKPDMKLPEIADTPVQIRAVEDGDFEALAQLDKEAFVEPLWWHSAEQLQRGAHHAAHFDVAELDGELVGFQYSTHGSGSYAHIVRVAVGPHHHGLGIGSALLESAVLHFRLAGKRRVSLNTQHKNASAQRLYQRFGFRPMGAEYAIWVLNLGDKKTDES